MTAHILTRRRRCPAESELRQNRLLSNSESTEHTDVLLYRNKCSHRATYVRAGRTNERRTDKNVAYISLT